jgi:hypothetical protein
LDESPFIFFPGRLAYSKKANYPGFVDLCFVWEDSAESLKAMLDRSGAKIIEGPVRPGAARAIPESDRRYYCTSAQIACAGEDHDSPQVRLALSHENSERTSERVADHAHIARIHVRERQGSAAHVHS